MIFRLFRHGAKGAGALRVTSALLASSVTLAQAQHVLPAIDVSGQHRVVSVPHAHTPAAPRVTRPAPVRYSPVVAPPPPAQPAASPPTSSSEKYFTGEEVNAIPFARPAEALEIVPGLVVAQHSGDGKANQYFLRGFNLDHGSDMALYLDGTPLNMRTHGHAQGYADANLILPELLQSVTARKGPYSAEDGDFSSAGSVYLTYRDRVEKGVFSATGGSFGYGRLFGMNSVDAYGGTILSAAEAGIYNGPWERPDSLRRINGVLRWSRGAQEDGASITAMAYANRWYATDQLPDRGVALGLYSLWGTTDPTDGGHTTRFSLSGRWSQTEGNHSTRVEAYAMRSSLDLYNNFTYFLSNQTLGDQFRQFDNRTMFGVNALHKVSYALAGFPVESRFGFQGRYDDIRLGLQDTWRRNAYDAIRNDYVGEGSLGLWTDTMVHWTPWLRTMGGARFDYYHASVNSIQTLADAPRVDNGAGVVLPLLTGPFNSGSRGAALVSPKAGFIVGPFYKTEFFGNYGEGFHSTDARGTVQHFSTTEIGGGSALDVGPLMRVAPVPLLVKSRGAELGLRTKAIEGLDSSLSFFWLNLDSENQFEGDSGTTTFGRPSRRFGLEFANHYRPVSWMRFDGDVALAHARYRGVDTLQTQAYAELITPAALPYGTFLGNAPGNYLTNSATIVALGGLELGEEMGWFGGLKYRYIGRRPLTEDGYIRSPATGTMNARLGYRWADGWRLQVDVFNIFNSRSDQITYGYGSLLRSDPLYARCTRGVAPDAVCATGVMGRHFKPVEPPAVRVTFGGPLNLDQPVTRLPDLVGPAN